MLKTSTVAFVYTFYWLRQGIKKIYIRTWKSCTKSLTALGDTKTPARCHSSYVYRYVLFAVGTAAII